MIHTQNHYLIENKREFKKNIFIILLLCHVLILNANMSSPVQQGTFGARPFLNQFVNVLHENISISIDKDFQYVNFNIEYIIQSEKNGIKIPLLFYASEYYDDFKITLDEKPVQLKKHEDFWDKFNVKNKKLIDFDYLYNVDIKEISEINIEFKKGKSNHIKLNDFIYFETDISKGTHRIKVSYKARKWQYKHRRISKTSFRYALFPAKYWKSFGTLDIKIDASKTIENISTNLGYPINGNLKTVALYHFTEIPVDIININLEPTLNILTKFLLKIESFRLTLFVFIFIIIYHIKLMFKHRKVNPNNLFSFTAILGGIIISFLFAFGLIFFSFTIDYCIGKYASGRESYGVFYSFLFLPKFWCVYLSFSLTVDYFIKRKITRSQTQTKNT